MLKELFRTYKRIILIILLLGSVLIFWFFTGFRKKNTPENNLQWEKISYANGGYGYLFENDSLKGKLDYGIKATIVKNKKIPVDVRLASKKGDFSGYIRIIIPGNNGGGIAYQSPIQCTGMQSNHFHLTIPQLGNASYFVFEIQDRYGNNILSRVEVPECSYWDAESGDVDGQICLGLFTDQTESFAYMDGLILDTDAGRMSVRLLYLDRNCMPDNPLDLSFLSGILMDDFTASQLTKKQRNVILSWVKNGGNLILGSGQYGKKQLDVFRDDLKLYAGVVESQRLYFDQDADFSGEVSMYVNQLTFEENAGWKMVKWSDPATFYEKDHGNGKIQVLRFSFTDTSILQWNRLNDMTASVLKRLLGSALENTMDEENGLWNMELALHDFNRSQTPNAFYYGIFFLLYLILLTFIIYILYRYVRKLEYMWMIVPAMALFFTACILLRSRGMSSQDSLSAIRLVDDQRENNDIYFLYQNAEGESKDLSLNPSVNQIVPMDYEYEQTMVDDGLLKRVKEDCAIVQNQRGYDVIFSEASPGTMRLLQMSEKMAMNYGEKTEIFSANISGDHTSFSGKISNLSDKKFDKVLVIRGNEYWTTRNLTAGGSCIVPGYEVACWSGMEEPGDAFIQDEDSVVIRDILNYLEYRYMKYNTDLSDLIVIGISLDDHYQLLRNRDTLGNQVSIYVNHLKMDLPEKADYSVNINFDCRKGSDSLSDLREKFQEKTEIDVRYQFDSKHLVWALARNKDDYEGKIYLYNYETGEFDERFIACHDVIFCEKLEPYLTEMNEMIVRYKQSEEELGSGIPILSMWQKKSVK